ncbi:hypothetical protein P7C73_g3077, partial [Tremellales sp. Uapishka_1]
MSWLLAFSILSFFVASYAVLAPRFETEKQKAYILSTISSFTMTLVSLPFLSTYVLHGLEGVYESSQLGWKGDLGRFGVVFFGCYLFSDLAIGYLKYPSQVGLLTGWIHHSVYIGLMVYLLQTRLMPIFLVGCIMELPTFHLAISHLIPSLRDDLLFLSLMFATRIAFHAFLLAHCALPSSRAITDGSWVPTAMLALAGVLHVGWFRGGVIGYLKRQRRSASKAAPKPTSELKEDSMALPPLVDDDTEESPIVTPYTPSQTPMSLRDTYFPIPTISIPTMPNLPTVSIPSLPFNIPNGDGFKDAVRGRWEELEEKGGSFMRDRGRDLENLGLKKRRVGKAEIRIAGDEDDQF